MFRRYYLALALLASSLVITTVFWVKDDSEKQLRTCVLTDQINALSINNLSYWSHIDSYPDEFAALHFFNAENGNPKYRLTQANLSKKQTIGAAPTDCYYREITLVKKLIHNKRQHANGIEMDLGGRQLTFGNLASFKMRFQLAPSLSSMPETSSLSDIIKTVLEGNEQGATHQKLIDGLLDKNIRLKLMIYGQNHSDSSVKTAYAEKLMILSPHLPLTKEYDAWVELEIKSDELNLYWQKNWQETPANQAELSDQPILGFILVAETPSSKTLESLLNELSESNTQLKAKRKFKLKDKELFIEHFIRLGSISIDAKAKN